jgi:hypothetical protein
MENINEKEYIENEAEDIETENENEQLDSSDPRYLKLKQRSYNFLVDTIENLKTSPRKDESTSKIEMLELTRKLFDARNSGDKVIIHKATENLLMCKYFSAFINDQAIKCRQIKKDGTKSTVSIEDFKSEIYLTCWTWLQKYTGVTDSGYFCSPITFVTYPILEACRQLDNSLGHPITIKSNATRVSKFYKKDGESLDSAIERALSSYKRTLEAKFSKEAKNYISLDSTVSDTNNRSYGEVIGDTVADTVSDNNKTDIFVRMQQEEMIQFLTKNFSEKECKIFYSCFFDGGLYMPEPEKQKTMTAEEVNKAIRPKYTLLEDELGISKSEIKTTYTNLIKKIKNDPYKMEYLNSLRKH